GETGDKDSFAQTSDIDISFSTTTDSGLTMSLATGFSDGATDDSVFKVSGDFGTIMIEDGGIDKDDSDAVESMDIDVDTYTNDEGYSTAAGTVKPAYGGGFSATKADSISYTLPAIAEGLSIAVALSDGEDDAKTTAYGLTYTGSTGTVGFKLAAAASSADNGTDETDQTHYGLEITSGAITLGLASNGQDKSDDNADYSSSEMGIKYAVSDVLTIAAMNRTAETGTATQDYEMTAYGVTYTIAPGLTTSVTSSDVDVNATNKDSRIVIALEASF
ncbi:MAG: porin, partial [Alphaproteobacteria bacterium]|nr:porin [Alphaproteobacteria bacterium]